MIKQWLGVMVMSLVFCVVGMAADRSGSKPASLYELQKRFMDYRFGVMMHFNMGTFSGNEWSSPKLSPDLFNPRKLDCEQWAKACKAGGVKYAILTTKHHDGFCLWDSKTTEHDVMSSPRKRDIVKEYVEAFRKHGIAPAFYYSIWDTNAKVHPGVITDEKIQFVLDQITELLTNYGEIQHIVFDGWSWMFGHSQIPYQTIREHVKKLQPDCLISDVTAVYSPWNMDVVCFEGGKGIHAQPDNIYASEIALNCTKGWFWKPDNATNITKSADSCADSIRLYEARYCNFVVNVSPNPYGLFDDNIVAMLHEIGAKWAPDLQRPDLPIQPPILQRPLHPAGAEAPGEASYLIDGRCGGAMANKVWLSDKLPARVTVDLGKVFEVGALSCFPQQFTQQHPNFMKTATTGFNPDEEGYKILEADFKDVAGGRILKYRILTSVDNKKFREVKSGVFENTKHVKVVEFKPTKARYVALDALTSVNGKYAAIDEIGVGRPNLR